MARIANLEDIQKDDSLDVEEKEGPKALLSLDPDNDFKFYYNILVTDVWIGKNKNIYKKHMQKELENFENCTGYSIRV